MTRVDPSSHSGKPPQEPTTAQAVILPAAITLRLLHLARVRGLTLDALVAQLLKESEEITREFEPGKEGSD